MCVEQSSGLVPSTSDSSAHLPEGMACWRVTLWFLTCLPLNMGFTPVFLPWHRPDLLWVLLNG